MCQKAYFEEYEDGRVFLQHYNDILDHIVIDERFDVVSRFSIPAPSVAEATGNEDIILFYEPYLQPFEEASYLAAATETAPVEDHRFCSEDGKYLLREYPGSIPGKTLFYLFGGKSVNTCGVKIEIDGKSYITGEKGLLDTSSAQLDLSSDSRVIIKGVLHS